MVQFIGKEVRVLDYYEAVGQELSEHVGWLRRNDYEEAKIYLPHDGVKHDSVFRVTYESAMKQAGFFVQIMPNAGAGAANQRIEAVRRIFPRVWMDAEKCEGGLEALGWYHEKKDESRNMGLGPEHDWSSHGADAFGAMALEAEKITHAQNNRGRPVQAQVGFDVFA
jgi:phage terminase large subunit